MEWFHELDCGKSLDVELGTQCSVCLIITVDGCEGEYPGHMFRCLGKPWSKVLAVAAPTRISRAIGVLDHGAKNSTMLACFELRIF